jgi:hypothetical protein
MRQPLRPRISWSSSRTCFSLATVADYGIGGPLHLDQPGDPYIVDVLESIGSWELGSGVFPGSMMIPNTAPFQRKGRPLQQVFLGSGVFPGSMMIPNTAPFQRKGRPLQQVFYFLFYFWRAEYDDEEFGEDAGRQRAFLTL